MALYFYQIVANFTHTAFPVIGGKPYYQIIHNMWTLLYGNTSTLTTKPGGGNHSQIRIIVRDMLYVTISPTPYDAPVDPGGTATFSLQ